MTTCAPERRIVLLTAGVGTRLGTLTERRNKGLISIANKAILGHVLEQLPSDVPVVVALGHFGDLVRQYLEIAYPDRMFIFRTVDPFQGPGSSSGYSLFSVRDLIPGPFLFCTNDTIIRQRVGFEGRNWVAVGISDDVEKYTRLSLFGDRVTRIHRKGEPGGSVAYTGLAEIHDASAFWQTLGAALERQGECSDIEGLFGLLSGGLHARMVQWYDSGNKDQFDRTMRELGGQGAHLPKDDEDLYFHDGRVIKFFADSQKAQQRIARARLLDGLVPEILASTPNFYSYRWVDGNMLSSVLTTQRILEFLEWAEKNLWTPRDVSGLDPVALGRRFYLAKTLERLDMLFSSGWVEDQRYRINGLDCERPALLLEKLDDAFYAASRLVQFHGDLHPDNIIVRQDGSGFVLCDWRENYGGQTAVGDLYYDLAKLYHGLLVSHDYVKGNKLSVDIQGQIINIDIAMHSRSLDCIEVLERWTAAHGLAVDRLRTIVALIYLNISPLHHFPYNQFLFFLGTRLLQRAISGSDAAVTS